MSALRVISEPAELWRPIAGFEGLYEVSTLGRVRALDRDVALTHRFGGAVTHRRRNLVRTPTADRFGRLQLALCRDGVVSYHGVAKLVLETFGQPGPHGWTIAHDDGDKSNCALSNIYWRPRNSKHARHEIYAVVERAFPVDGSPPDALTRLAAAIDATHEAASGSAPPTPPASPGPDA